MAKKSFFFSFFALLQYRRYFVPEKMDYALLYPLHPRNSKPSRGQRKTQLSRNLNVFRKQLRAVMTPPRTAQSLASSAQWFCFDISRQQLSNFSIVRQWKLLSWKTISRTFFKKTPNNQSFYFNTNWNQKLIQITEMMFLE